MLCSFQGALLQSEFVDWAHGGVHWDSLKLPVFAYDGTSTPCTSGAFVVCCLAGLCTSIILVNTLGYVNNYGPRYFQGCKVRSFKCNVKKYRLKGMRPLQKPYVEESGKAEGKGTKDGFPWGKALPQHLWGMQVGQATCLEMKGPSSVSQ